MDSQKELWNGTKITKITMEEQFGKAIKQYNNLAISFIKRRLTLRTWLLLILGFFIIGIGIWKIGGMTGVFKQAEAESPVMYLQFNEGVGSTVNDSTGNNNRGNFGPGTSAPLWINPEICASDNCINFDGTSDYITINDSATFDNATGANQPRTVTAWLRFTSPATMVIMEKGTANHFYLNTNSAAPGKVSWSCLTGSSNDVSTNSGINDNKWHHVAGVYDGSLLSIYVDGVRQNETNNIGANCPDDDNAPIYVGQRSGGSNPYSGSMDEVKIYDYARTAAEIKADYLGGKAGFSAVFGAADNGFLTDGLMGYWKMDEVGVSGSNWTAVDSSGNTNNGTGAGNASVGTTASGKFGNAGFFDGNGDQVVVPDSSTLDVGPKATWSLWFKMDTLPSAAGYSYRLLDKWVGTGNQRSFQLYVATTNKIHMDIDPDGTGTSGVDVASDNSLNTDTWYHVVVVADGTKAYMYVNNVKQADVKIINAVYASTASLYIASDTNSLYFNGSIDDIRIYNRALSDSEVKALYEWVPGPVGYWKMDDGTGTSVTDSSGNIQTGSLGTGNSSPKWAVGKYGSSLYFDGDNDYFSVTDSTNSPIDFTNQMSMMAWVKPSAVDSNLYIFIEKGEPDEYEFYLSGATNKFAVEIGDGVCNFKSVVTAGKWYHVAATWDGSTIYVYQNGVLDTTCARAYTMTPDNTNLTIGYNPDTNADHWYGSVDDVKLYNYVRTQKQIVEDMNGSHPAPGSPVGSTFGYFRMDEGYGTTINNAGSAGIGLTGTFASGSSAPLWSNNGKFGKAISFDGTNDWIGLGVTGVTKYVSGVSALTLSAWVNMDSVPTGNQVIIGGYIGIGQSTGYQLVVGANGFNVGGRSIPSESIISGTTPFSDTNSWHHLLGIIDYANDKLFFYIDGILKRTETVAFTNSTLTVTGGNMQDHIGSNSTQSFFKGKLDEIKIYNYALTEEEVKVEYNQGKSLVLGAVSTDIGGTRPSFSESRAYCVPGDASICNSPVGQWSFNEGVGLTVNDISSSGNQGNISGAVYKKGRSSTGIYFDGNGDYIRVSPNTNINNLTALTVETWIKQEASANNTRIIGKNGNSTTNGWRVQTDNSNRIEFIVLETGGTQFVFRESTTNAIINGTWYHVAVSWDGTNNYTGVRIYVNGKETAYEATGVSGSGSRADDSSLDICLGSRCPSAIGELEGTLDEVKLYNYVRTPAQIAWDYNLGAPIAWYRMDECQGTTVYNAAKNANGKAMGYNATITIGAGVGQTSAGTCSSGSSSEAWNNGTNGKFNASINFDGSDDYIATQSDVDLFDFKEGEDFSYTVWVKPSTLASSSTILSKKNGPGSGGIGYLSYITTQGKIATYISDGTDEINKFTDVTINAGEWSHIAVVYQNNTDVITYINGKDGRGTLNGTIANVDNINSAYKFVIGAEDDIQVLYAGQIDDVRIYNFALTPQQIKLIQNNGAVRFE